MRRDHIDLVNVLVLSAVATAILAIWVFVDLGGWTYYTTPLRIRGYAPQHATLKPSGSVSHVLGLVGLAMLTVPIIYAVRKKWSRLARTGSLAAWLEVHIFCGIVGPMLVTAHTAFKFNGIISVAYWSMMIVMCSGFVGRYWYVRIPKTIRGVELTRGDIESRITSLTENLTESGSGGDVVEHRVQENVGRWWHQQRLRRRLIRDGVAEATARGLVGTLAERDMLIRRLASLERTKKVLAAWHAFHVPLVYVTFGIATLHVGVALYMGYSFF